MTITLTQPIREAGAVVASGTTITRAPDIEADLVARGFANPIGNAPGVPGISQFGDRINVSNGLPTIPFSEKTPLISYFWKWPGTNGTARYGEHHIYVPAGNSNHFFGTILGVRTKSAYMVPYEACVGLFQPGLYTSHASCTKTGTWSSTDNAAALVGSYSHSSIAGSKIEANVTGSTLAVHQFLATNGGYAVVKIDDKYTFESPLPIFTSADLSANRCRSEDVGRKYLNFYHSDSWSKSEIVATGLSESQHSLELECIAKAPAASSGVRIVVEALIGCSATTSCSNASTHMVPVRVFYEMLSPSFSSFYATPMFAPAGSAVFKFIGASHADNTDSRELSVSGPTVTIDGVDRSAGTAGTYYSGLSILWYQESTISHKDALGTPVLNRKRRYSAKANRQLPIIVDVTHTWLAAGTVEIFYPMMYPCGGYDFQRKAIPIKTPEKVWLGSTSVNISEILENDNSTSFCGVQDYLADRAPATLAVVYDDCMTWAALLSEESPAGTHFSGEARYQIHDRSDGIEKLYVASNYDGFVSVAVDDVERYICGWGALMFRDCA